MNEISLPGYLLIFVNALFTFNGFRDVNFLNKYSFKIDEILIHKDYKRLVSSGFLHVNWLHFLMNMASLYFFSEIIIISLGIVPFFIIYFISLIGGNLLALYVHRNHGDYSAIGASGAVCGLIFGCIALYPENNIHIFGLELPGWLFGIIYVLLTISGIRTNASNIGHEAHLGGGIVGLLLSLTFFPAAILDNYIPILLIVVPSFAFIIYIIYRPAALIIDGAKKQKDKFWDIEEKYHYEKKLQADELDKLLEKISKKGIKSLSDKERERLKELSKK